MRIVASACLILAVLFMVGCATFPAKRQAAIGDVIEPGVMVNLWRMDAPDRHTQVELFIPMTITTENVVGVIRGSDGKWRDIVLPTRKFRTGVYHVSNAK
jgi:hypothetical protein